jgi:formate-dependent nitrite reductase membrane component NrfD
VRAGDARGTTGNEAGDGRNIDPSIGTLEGEASQQQVPARRAGSQGSARFDLWTGPPSQDGDRRGDATYYERPVIKEPTWIWSVPAYFYTGGAAGAAALLAAAAQVLDRDGLRGLIQRSRWIAALGAAAGAGLLVHDLGRPERFLNMLRVFRPSSPMSMGSWTLAAMAPMAASSAVLAGADGVLGTVGDVAGLNAGLAGMPLAGYTAVLISNTAVPVWQATRRTTPPLFIASAVASAGSLLQMMKLNDSERRIVRRFAVAGALAELASSFALEREAGTVERVARPLHEGAGGALLKAAKALTGASLLLTVLPGASRLQRLAAGVLGTAGAIAVKFGIFEAGKASARDPRATFHQQRAGYGAAEVTGEAAVTEPDFVQRGLRR